MFVTEKVHENITRIRDIAGTCMYLIEGQKKAMLVDTGVGAGSLKKIVEGLTSKPVTVIVTHGHVDHAMGATEFETVYMNPADKEVYKVHSDLKMRLGYIRSSANYPGCEKAGDIKAEDLMPVKDFDSFLPLDSGDEFDLGDLTVKILDGKGHTPGTQVLLIPELKVLILGDACNNFTYLFDCFCPSVETFMETMIRLKKETEGLYDRVLLCHGPGDGNPDLIDSVIEVCKDIMSGNTDDIPFESLGQKALIAKKMNFECFCRIDGKSGNIVYDPDKVHNSKCEINRLVKEDC